MRLVAVTGVSIGAINAACIVGAKDRTDARRRLRALWADLTLETPAGWWPAASSNLSLFGLPGFYAPRRDVWNALNWTSYYDTEPMLGTLAKYVDFGALNAQRDRVRRDRRRRRDRHAVALQQSSATRTRRRSRSRRAMCWRAAACRRSFPQRRSTARATGTAASSTTRRWATRSRRFRRDGDGRALPRGDEPVPQGTPAAEEHDRGERSSRRAALRQPAAAGQRHAETVNALVRTVDRLAGLVPDDSLDVELRRRHRPRAAVQGAGRDHRHRSRRSGADGGGRARRPRPSSPAASATSPRATIQRRHDAGHKLAQLKLQETVREARAAARYP